MNMASNGESINKNVVRLVETHLSSVAPPALVSSAPATVLVESVSHEDSTISQPRDQDYLSLWVGSGNEVELQQALSKYGG